jgi:hypothetical protein
MSTIGVEHDYLDAIVLSEEIHLGAEASASQPIACNRTFSTAPALS